MSKGTVVGEIDMSKGKVVGNSYVKRKGCGK
jgi:hypothetical protein